MGQNPTAVANHSGHNFASIVDKTIFLLVKFSLVPDSYLHIWKDALKFQQAMFEIYFSNNALFYFFFGFGE